MVKTIKENFKNSYSDLTCDRCEAGSRESVTCSDVPWMGGPKAGAGADQHRGHGGLLPQDIEGEGEEGGLVPRRQWLYKRLLETSVETLPRETVLYWISG